MFGFYIYSSLILISCTINFSYFPTTIPVCLWHWKKPHVLKQWCSYFRWNIIRISFDCMILLSSASRSKRKQVIAIWKLFFYFILFFTHTSCWGARSSKNKSVQFNSIQSHQFNSIQFNLCQTFFLRSSTML